MIADGLVLIGSYLLGSVLFGVIVVRATRGADPRSLASGNPGATNVMRVAGKGAGAAALVLDAGKGTAAVLLARAVSPPGSALPAAAAVAAVVGHLFPVFYGFRGGKGVATASGAFLALSMQPVLAAVVVFAAVLGAFRLVSLASMTAVVSFAPLCVVWGEPNTVLIAAVVVGLLVVARHHENISRLRRGVEPRLRRSGSGRG
jgi:glycerol-3-phosphate acyltransferase PlsY